MAELEQVVCSADSPQILRSLLHVGVNLAAIDDLPALLHMVLREARRLAGAEAGNLYLQHGGALRLAFTQNASLAPDEMAGRLEEAMGSVGANSLVGFVAATGRPMNIPDSHHLPSGAPFRIGRDLDAVTGYRSESILAVPMKLLDGAGVGVVELINHIDRDGHIAPFPDHRAKALDLLAFMAAGAVHNALARERTKRANLNVIIDLSVAAECGDDETAAHIRRVSEVAALIAKALSLPTRQVEVIRFATTMHDIGNIGVPEDILRKTGVLADDERNRMQRHAEIGAEVVPHPLNDVVEAACTVALTHHERWDGTGYPEGLAGEEIPLVGRIVTLADVFDALLSPRPYRDAHTWDQALRVVRDETGKHFDPRVVRAFLACLEDVADLYRSIPTFDDAA